MMKLFQSELSITEFGVAHVVGSSAGDESVIFKCTIAGMIVIAPSRVFNGLPIGGKCRVEIQSIDDPPWPDKRPKGWGSDGGYWLQFLDHAAMLRDAISVVVGDRSVYAFIPSTRSLELIDVKLITSYGPRAEVSG